MSELVTGEAVVLGVRPARLPSRALAVVVDLVAAFSLYVAVSLALTAAVSSLDEAAGAAVSVATFLLVLVGVPIAVETLSRGRSLGKLMCGLRVVRDDGGPIRFRHALVRGAVGAVEILMTFGVIAVIASLVSARGRRLGDVFAGTLVVRERVPGRRNGPVPAAPDWLRGRFSGLDLSTVPDSLWLAVRQYLTRKEQLDPEVGGRLAERLAADLARHTGAPVPPEIPPAMYLAGVVAERQTRDARRVWPGTDGAAAPGARPGGGEAAGRPGGTGEPSGAGPGAASEGAATRPGTSFVPPGGAVGASAGGATAGPDPWGVSGGGDGRHGDPDAEGGVRAGSARPAEAPRGAGAAGTPGTAGTGFVPPV
ncbi:RDD family protein [Streptomyces zingiberis]|uniref:RDD family protein n=1 Tax=Streptomyces zingiberis TaxID=2053010 RepID=A0ABX1BYC9_9ACTN|nr:RDD family protein [Streptomyces zingiberis]NJQ02699.1 RDD family protein [Streptomyces zingiberis]